MKNMKKCLLSTCILISLFFAGTCDLAAQARKKHVSIDDVKKWRRHSVSLSDDGRWYTVLYSLTEKPQDEKEVKKKDSLDIAKNLDFYGKEYKTDVLYICQAGKGVKYEIPKGENPRFSRASDWIAYSIKSKSEKNKGNLKQKNSCRKEKSLKTIELKNLKTGLTRQYKSNAAYQFTRNADYFITSDKKSLLVYDLENNGEHYIGNTGEFLIDKKSEYIAYTIAAEDKRGNGIYLYNPETRTTRNLLTGNFVYSNLAWNKNRDALAALKYEVTRDKVDFKKMSILVISSLDKENLDCRQYAVSEMTGMPENMGPAVKHDRYNNEIAWSNDGKRLFIKIRKYESPQKKDDLKKPDSSETTTVDVWHWKDNKLLSQKMMEEKRKKNEVWEAIFYRKSRRIVPLTSKKMQHLLKSAGTDRWAIGTDNREYISDWDVSKNDLYKFDLITGKKTLILEEYAGRVIEISPDGEKVILWRDSNYQCYSFKDEVLTNLTSGLNVSFVNKEDDHWGFKRAYGFAGWVKNQNAIIVYHKLDLWLLPLDGKSSAVNLTKIMTDKKTIRFRIADMSFRNEKEIEKRYIDLSSPLILEAFNIKTKYAGYFELRNTKLKKLIYKPASFTASRWGGGLVKAKKSKALIYKLGDYQNYPEAYLSDNSFSKSLKITNTNPQQKDYIWGHRILIEYNNDDGVPLQGVLSIPNDYIKGSKLPMIVYSYEKMSDGLYRYPSPRLSGSSICEMMYVSDGYLFLQPDIHFNVGTPHSDMFECIDSAIEKVIALGYVDEKKIGYEGFSYGGHCGMFMSTQKNKFAAIAAGAGVSNLVQGFSVDIVADGSNEQDYYMTGQGRLGTDPVSDTQMFISESAVFQAGGMNTPLLLFHGTSDQVVKWEHSFGFYSILRYLKKPVIFLSYKGEGHGLRKKANRLDIQIRLKEYFDYYLKGKDAAAWIIEGIEYKPEKKSPKSGKDMKKSSELPLWK